MSPDRVAAWLTPCCGACKRNKSIKKRGTGVLRFFVRSLEPFERLRLPQDIVDAHVVKNRRLDEDVGGELLLRETFGEMGRGLSPLPDRSRRRAASARAAI